MDIRPRLLYLVLDRQELRFGVHPLKKVGLSLPVTQGCGIQEIAEKAVLESEQREPWNGRMRAGTRQISPRAITRSGSSATGAPPPP